MHDSVLIVKLAVNTKMDCKKSLSSMPLKMHTCDHIFVVEHFHSPPVKRTDRRDPAFKIDCTLEGFIKFYVEI